MAYAQSSPGVSTNRSETPQKAGNVLTEHLLKIDSWIIPVLLWNVLSIILKYSYDIGRKYYMDDIDKKIIALLQEDGRLSVTDISSQVGLSLSPCHRRIRNMEEDGIISGYRAQIDPSRIGLGFSAIVFVTLRESNSTAVEAFEKAVLGIRQVILAQRLFGDPDYFLQIVTVNLSYFQKLYDEKLSKLPYVQRLTSTLVMKTVVRDRPISMIFAEEN